MPNEEQVELIEAARTRYLNMEISTDSFRIRLAANGLNATEIEAEVQQNIGKRCRSCGHE